MAKIRIRQHVNPLSNQFKNPFIIPNWQQIYSDITKPFYLDIGCAKGRFLLKMAQNNSNINFLGIEIRQQLVIDANRLRDDHNLENLHYIFTNINNNIDTLLSSLPQNSLKLVLIQFPDPWFKKKHSKRRVVQPELIETLAKYLPQNSKIFLQSDIQEIAEEMKNRFLTNANFQPIFEQIWLEENPLQIQTEREIATLNKNKPVYRTLLIKV